MLSMPRLWSLLLMLMSLVMLLSSRLLLDLLLISSPHVLSLLLLMRLVVLMLIAIVVPVITSISALFSWTVVKSLAFHHITLTLRLRLLRLSLLIVTVLIAVLRPLNLASIVNLPILLPRLRSVVVGSLVRSLDDSLLLMVLVLLLLVLPLIVAITLVRLVVPSDRPLVVLILIVSLHLLVLGLELSHSSVLHRLSIRGPLPEQRPATANGAQELVDISIQYVLHAVEEPDWRNFQILHHLLEFLVSFAVMMENVEHIQTRLRVIYSDVSSQGTLILPLELLYLRDKVRNYRFSI